LFNVTVVVFVIRAGSGKGELPLFVPGFHGGIDEFPAIAAADTLTASKVSFPKTEVLGKSLWI
jgi:hypothetical protein